MIWASKPNLKEYIKEYFIPTVWRLKKAMN